MALVIVTEWGRHLEESIDVIGSVGFGQSTMGWTMARGTMFGRDSSNEDADRLPVETRAENEFASRLRVRMSRLTNRILLQLQQRIVRSLRIPASMYLYCSSIHKKNWNINVFPYVFRLIRGVTFGQLQHLLDDQERK